MLNRFKLIVFLAIASISIVLLVQNRDPLFLKVFCNQENSQSCFYQTPSLPLSVWMGLFFLGGAISSLVAQSLNSFANFYSNEKVTPNTNYNKAGSNPSVKESSTQNKNRVDYLKKDKPKKDKKNSSFSDWDEQKNEDWGTQTTSKTSSSKDKHNSYERQEFNQKKDNKTVDSSYSYQNKNNNDSVDKTPKDRLKKDSRNKNNPDNRIDRVYDVNFRPINDYNRNKPSGEQNITDDDEEWI